MKRINSVQDTEQNFKKSNSNVLIIITVGSFKNSLIKCLFFLSQLIWQKQGNKYDYLTLNKTFAMCISFVTKIVKCIKIVVYS